MWRKLLGLTAVVAVLTLGFWGVASAHDFRTGDTTNVNAGETVNSTVWTAGRTVNIAGNVNGDVFCAGQTVTISGNVQGDVICAAQTLIISGKISGDARIAAQTLTLTGQVAGNLTSGAQTFTQAAGSLVGSDASLGGSDVTLNGNIGRDLLLGAGTAYLNGQVGRDVKTATTTLSLGSNAKVAGNLAYTSDKDVTLAPGAAVLGQTTKTVPQHQERNFQNRAGAWIGMGLFVLVALLVTALVLVLVFPKVFQTITAYKWSQVWKPLLVGLVALVVTPAVAILAMVTVIGLPLGLLLILTWLLLGGLSAIATAYWLGRVLWRGQTNAILVMLLGVIVIGVLLMVPILGMIVRLLVILVGAGLILLGIKNRLPKIRYNLK